MMELLPMMGEANAISETLNKHRSFEVAVLSGTMAVPRLRHRQHGDLPDRGWPRASRA